MIEFLCNRPTWQSLDLEIGTTGVKVVTKDRRILNLSFQEKELEDLIMWQVGVLCKVFETLHNNYHLAKQQNFRLF